ncbi:hypothetical protein AB4059_01525 [Lysobacter sp. 2RAF19]
MTKKRRDPLTAAGYRVRVADDCPRVEPGTMTNVSIDWPPSDPLEGVVMAELSRLRTNATLRGFTVQPGLWDLVREHMLALLHVEHDLLHEAAQGHGRKGPAKHPYPAAARAKIKTALNEVHPGDLHEPGTAAKVAKETGTDPSYVRRILREDYPQD